MISAFFSERSSVGNTLCPVVTAFHWRVPVLSLLDFQGSPVPAGGGAVGQVPDKAAWKALLPPFRNSGQKRKSTSTDSLKFILG